jgi:hypothetical protein
MLGISAQCTVIVAVYNAHSTAVIVGLKAQ